MNRYLPVFFVVSATFAIGRAGFCEDAVQLPPGVKAVWDLEKAFREKTPTRERICINGLWRWQPAASLPKSASGDVNSGSPPTEKWGYLKVPASWPGALGMNSGETQQSYSHPDWTIQAEQFAWYQREVTLPAEWKERDIFIDINWLQSIANVFLDGKPAGTVQYPGGKLNIKAQSKPGEKQVLSICVAALPLSEEMTSFAKFNLSVTSKASVARRGLCGDVFLESTPAKARLGDVKVAPSVRKWELGVNVAVANLGEQEFRIKGDVFDGDKKVHSFESKPFKSADAKDGRFDFASPWKPEKLWDTNATGNMYHLQLTLVDAQGKAVDTLYPQRFGFREFWIDGRDFRLNGSKFHVNASPYEGALMSVYNASYAGAKEALSRLKDAGFNLVYSHNYDCLPGSNLSYEDTLRAADDVGVLFAFALPNYANNYTRDPKHNMDALFASHVDYYTRQTFNHPAVVLYAVDHNAYGYSEDINPELIHTFPDFMMDAAHPGRRVDGKAKQAQTCEEMIRRFDRTRPIYHHGGNIGDIASPNCYLNLVPVQEVSDWFGTWASKGNRPLFLTEYGTACDADFTMFRGYDLSAKGEVNLKLSSGGMRQQGAYFYGSPLRIEYHLPGYGSQFRGDIAYQLTEKEEKNLRAEADLWKKHNPGWKFWAYPVNVNTPFFDAANEREVQAMYVADNWPAFRALGVSAICTWYYSELFQLKPNPTKGKPVQMRSDWKKGDRELPILPIACDWEHLQKPGYSADWENALERYGEMESGRPYSHAKEDWLEVPYLTKAWLRVTRPALAYIAGKTAHLTGKDHNFYPGEAVEKQFVVINDSRAPLSAECEWKINLPAGASEKKQLKVESGEQTRAPISIRLPEDLKAGEYEISLSAKFDTGETQSDSFAIHVMQKPAKPATTLPISLFDPAGKTKKVLSAMGVAFTEVNADAKPSAKELLIIGKDALSLDGPAPDLAAVRQGLKVIVFEQSTAVLDQRLGFRPQEYGLRNLFPRFADHPLLAGTDAKNWANWRGASGATLASLKLREWESGWKYCSELITTWSGVTVNRSWRGSTYGAVSSVFIEKPARGDFLPVLEGGFSLQYAPLLEFREGKGMVLFCQLDVSNRDETEPAADTLVRNILKYADAWHPAAERKAFYAGDAAGKAHLEKIGIAAAEFAVAALTKDDVLIVGPGGGQALSAHAAAIAEWLKQGGNLLAIGATEAEANAFLPFKVSMKAKEHLSTVFPLQSEKSLFAGINPAGVHSREPRALPLLVAGPDVDVLGDGILGKAKNANVIFYQMIPWTYDVPEMHNLKTSYRHSSVLLNRLLANMGVRGTTTLLSRFSAPATASGAAKELYVDAAVEGDDPYRQFGW